MATYEEYCRKRGIPFTPPAKPEPVLKVIIEDAPEEKDPETKPTEKKAPAKKKASATKSKAKA